MSNKVAEKIADMDALTSRNMLEIAGLQWIKAGSERFKASSQMRANGVFDADAWNRLTDRFNILQQLHSKMVDKVGNTPMTNLDWRKKATRESFFK